MGVADPFVGKVLEGRYRVIEKLGEGGMSAVYLAEEASSGSRVAVKVLHDHLVSDQSQKERFEREARALFGLEHPHILQVHDFGVVDGVPFLVMELLDGQTLDQLVEDDPPDPETGLAIAQQVLSGLAFAHGQGVLHRDLKTENVFVGRDANGRPSARLLDFGLVKFVDDQRWGSGKALTAFGEVFGTPAYMSPEQATGAPVGPPTDVYAMGVVLFEMLTGVWPFMEETRVDMMRAHMMKPPPTVAETRPDLEVRPELEAVIQRALQKEPAQRFADAGQMLAALEAVPRPATWPRGQQPMTPPAAPVVAATREPTWVPQQPGAAPKTPSWVPWVVAGAGLLMLAMLAMVVTVLLLR